jgi:hypothetical protein
VIVTSTRVLSPASFQAARFAPNAAKCAPYLSVEEITELVGQTYAPLDQAEAWGLTIHIAASVGHPQLTAEKVVSLTCTLGKRGRRPRLPSANGLPSIIIGDPTPPMAGSRPPWSTSTPSKPISRCRQ